MRALGRLFKPVDIFPLVLFRIFFGALMSWEISRYFTNGWIYSHFVEPKFFFTYYGFEWVHPWPGNWMVAHFCVLLAAAICIGLGLCYRLSAAVFFLGFTYAFLIDQTHYLNHFYLISLLSLLLIFVPAHRMMSVDAWLRPKILTETAPAWALWLLRIQVGIPYFFGGIAKINSDWLHGRPLGDWLLDLSNTPVIGGLVRQEWVGIAASWGSMLLDLLMFPFLLWPETRRWAMVAAILFHLANSQLFTIGVFPWMMIAATLILFVPPQMLRKFFNVPSVPALRKPVLVSPGGKIVTAALLTAYLTIQFLMPFRHLLYPGAVSWTEEGHLFSWHMKLRDKDADVQFFVTDPRTGQVVQVNALEYLTPMQELRMSTRPDMILQFCHYLADQFRAKGNGQVQVRVKAMASLNGRKKQYLIDPNMDLAAQPRTWRSASWIMPLTEPPPSHHARPQGTPES
jgi:hypothetical protein